MRVVNRGLVFLFGCDNTLDFVSVPGFPSAILVFALTHSRRIVFQR